MRLNSVPMRNRVATGELFETAQGTGRTLHQVAGLRYRLSLGVAHREARGQYGESRSRSRARQFHQATALFRRVRIRLTSTPTHPLARGATELPGCRCPREEAASAKSKPSRRGERTKSAGRVSQTAHLSDRRRLLTCHRGLATRATIPCFSRSRPTLSRWKNEPSARDLVCRNDWLFEQFIRLCRDQAV